MKEDTTVSELRAFIERRAEAVRRKSVETATASVAADVIFFDVLGPLQSSGSDALEKRTREWFSSFKGPIGFEMRQLDVTTADDLGFSHSLNQVKATRADGQKLEMWWRSTACYRKTRDGWKVTHEHNSVPFDAETGMASLNLEP